MSNVQLSINWTFCLSIRFLLFFLFLSPLNLRQKNKTFAKDIENFTFETFSKKLF